MKKPNEPPIDVDALEVKMVGMEAVEAALARGRVTADDLAALASTRPE